MANMIHQVEIGSDAATVYDALTTEKGLASWWTRFVEAKPEEGSRARFTFGGEGGFTMRIAKLEEGRRIVWECEGDHDEWKGTRLTWEIEPVDGGCVLRFVHAGWKSTEGWFGICNSTWGELMHRLKAHAEGKNPGPHFPRRG